MGQSEGLVAKMTFVKLNLSYKEPLETTARSDIWICFKTVSEQGSLGGSEG